MAGVQLPLSQAYWKLAIGPSATLCDVLYNVSVHNTTLRTFWADAPFRGTAPWGNLTYVNQTYRASYKTANDGVDIERCLRSPLESHPPVNTLHHNAAIMTLAGVLAKARPRAGAGRRHLLTHSSSMPSFATGTGAQTIRLNFSDVGNVSALLNASTLEAGDYESGVNYTWPRTAEQFALVAESTAEVTRRMAAAFRASYPRHALPSEYVNGTVKPKGMVGLQYGYRPDPAGMFLTQARLSIIAAGPLAGAARLLANGTITTRAQWQRLVNLTALMESNFTKPAGAEVISNFTRDNLVLAPPAPTPPEKKKKGIWEMIIDFFTSVNPIFYAIFCPIIVMLCCGIMTLRVRVALAIVQAKKLEEKLAEIDPKSVKKSGKSKGKLNSGEVNPFEEPDEYSDEKDGDDFKTLRKKRAAKRRKNELIESRNARLHKLKRCIKRQKEYLAYNGLLYRTTDEVAAEDEAFVMPGGEKADEPSNRQAQDETNDAAED